MRLEGKMYGVLLVETPSGKQQVLKAFSGLLKGESVVEGWVPPIPGREQVALEETRTLVSLETIQQALMALQQRPDLKQYEASTQEFETRLQQLAVHHQQRKQERQRQRQAALETLQGEALARALEQLNEQSRQDGIERRHLKRQRDSVLQPLKHRLDQTDDRIRALKQQRKERSRQLQVQMHASYQLTNFAGQTLPLQVLMPQGAMPTGTGDCCAPKLLHFAATQGFKPLAMTEFWWGPSSTDGDKVQGAFYGACAERCQPLMGFLLSGMTEFSRPQASAPLSIEETEASRDVRAIAPCTLLTVPLLRQAEKDLSLPILYTDDWLIAVDKPAGLLSVPGRYADRQDSVLNRLRVDLPDGRSLLTVHRLDQATSGILLLARDAQTYRHLSQQFQQRTVHKVYEAVLSGSVKQANGVIDLPLWGNPCDRPHQTVDWQRGKPSMTRFQVIAKAANSTRVAFFPFTGRTHQIRVHAADREGLGVPILGDRLYGCHADADRLHLHARELRFEHPQSGQTLHLQSTTSF
jgi:tRNA pseudouridine32 synthase/23S rRNA pseudouridine746 synthase